VSRPPIPALAGLLALLGPTLGGGVALAPRPALADTPVSLKAGQDYMLAIDSGDIGGTASVTDPAGRTVASVQGYPFSSQGTEFRARFTAVYFVRASPPGADVTTTVTPDCRNGPATLCHLALNHTKHSRFDSGTDGDWWRLSLRAGRLYRISYASASGSIVELRDARGRIVPGYGKGDGTGTFAFRPRTSGAYFLVLANGCDSGCGDGLDYTIGLR
jgi:hypothetical protein